MGHLHAIMFQVYIPLFLNTCIVMQSSYQRFIFCLDAHRENAYEDDEAEAYTYLMPETYDGGLASKSSHKKKQQQRMNGRRPYDNGVDLPYDRSHHRYTVFWPLKSICFMPQSFGHTAASRLGCGLLCFLEKRRTCEYN